MNLTVLTALTIQTNDVICDAGGPDPETGKYVGWITHNVEKRYRPIINTQPIYETKDAAKSAMEALVKEIRSKSIEELSNGPSASTDSNPTASPGVLPG